MMSLLVVLLLVTAVSSQSRNFHMDSCSVTMSCGGSNTGMSSNDGSRVVGFPGKRGEPGLKGEPGEKGRKGDCENSDDEFAIIRRQISALTPQKKCPQTKFRFPRANQVDDYIRIKSPIPEMSELTICSWINAASASVFNDFGFVSYATLLAEANTISLIFKSTTRLEIILNNESLKVITLPAISGRTHICVAVNRKLGWAKVYTNGARRGALTYSKRNPIPGGGVFLIGQEQDSLFGGLDRRQAFSGEIENFTKWYRVLSDTEIRDVYRDPCRCPTDYALSLSSDEIQLEGKVFAKPCNAC